MGSIRLSDTTEALFMDFRFDGQRCREYTSLPDTLVNRKKLEKALDKIESEIAAGTFVYVNCFPNSKALKRLNRGKVVVETPVAQAAGVAVNGNESMTSIERGPLFSLFANQWVDDHSIEWRRSHIKSLLSTLNGRLIPEFGNRTVGSITKADILAFRTALSKVKGRGEATGLSAKRINQIIGLLRQILSEAADQFQFTSPALSIKKLRVRRTDVNPFSLVDVQRVMATVRADYKDYFTVRFLTGMRTGEVHGLKWKYIDWDLRIIRVRETFVLGEDEYTKTDGSQRDIQMSQPVFEALQRQLRVTGKVCDYVFCSQTLQPLDNKNFSDRIWYPLLRNLGLEKRRPYQMRHTAATLWLASGEAPEWIANQLGHTSTEMLFRVYSRYVPNLTRQDGSAMERLLASQLSQGPLIAQQQPGSSVEIYVPAHEAAPMPKPKPRGVQGAKPAHKTDRSEVNIPVLLAPPAMHAQQPATPAFVTPEVTDIVVTPASRAQPPPLAWGDLAATWMSTHPDQPLN
jgi:integrase